MIRPHHEVENAAMNHIAILDDYQNAALASADWESIKSAEITVFNEYIGDENAVAETLQPFEVVVAMRERTPFPASLIARLPNLKLLITTGMRNLAIDMEAAHENGVVVSGTQMLPYLAFEHAWALILAITKNIPTEDRTMKAGGWQAGSGIGLNGKTVGILGLGKLGSQSARAGLAFGMEVIAWSENLTNERAAEHGAVRVEKDELFERSDVLTIHLLLSERTRGLVGARELELMKPTAYLVNTSRGPIVDETALIEVLEKGRIAGAGIDVYDTEPLPVDHPLRGLDNTVLTGHTGYVVSELYELVYGEAIEGINAWIAGTPVRVLNA
ncbi:MAG: Glycerate dehydrogenase [Alphaproteobacteria bacterium MarineAlpha3_Bin4]|nr:MAG: Glycerate dehydrogenase [Alphaproteobacteria bacterium MarineAlpha3_Bin4]